MSRNCGFEDNVTPFLDLVQLKKEEKNPDRVHKKIFKMILAKCHDKIRKINKATEFKECYYDIPWFIPGYPGYDLRDVNRYLSEQLILNGLYVQPVNSQRIYISWKPQDINFGQYKQQSKKMVPSHNLYKVQVSPLADDPGLLNALPPGSKKASIDGAPEDPNPVMMMRYDNRFEDLIPVNTKKVAEIYPDLSHQKQSLDVSDDKLKIPVQGHTSRRPKPAIHGHGPPQAPEYADRYNERHGYYKRF